MVRPRDDRTYARASWDGAWSGTKCPECGRNSVGLGGRVPPLRLEWLEGSDVVGDFVWAGLAWNLVTPASVSKKLAAIVRPAFRRGLIEHVAGPPPKLGQRIPTPDDTAELEELWIDTIVPIDRERSAVQCQTCTTCGEDDCKLTGTETWDSTFDWTVEDLVYTRIPRARGGGIVIDAAALGDTNLFRVREARLAILCTDRLRDLILDGGFTNIDFLEYGEVR